MGWFGVFYVRGAFALALVASAGGALGADTAAGQQPREEACFSTNQFEGWRAPDDKTVYVRANGSHVFRFDL